MTTRRTVNEITSDELDALYEELALARQHAEQAAATIHRVRAYAAETARFMKDGTNDHDIGRYDTAVCVLDALREDAERFDEAEDAEAKLKQAQAAIARVRALADQWDNALAPARSQYSGPVRAALDGTGQPEPSTATES
ncbi:hypothetical protein [Streptomyces sp. DH20]|uniref:hypothetical protein n=1 Tax=Streptomyces sp. DH20 TaxID=2857009 RepID=UPI001E4E6DFA|nr:hypothetical protein [Streptomyces sp. DH20]